jgi:hypothetical protein
MGDPCVVKDTETAALPSVVKWVLPKRVQLQELWEENEGFVAAPLELAPKSIPAAINGESREIFFIFFSIL